MIIPINICLPTASNAKLPPSLAKISHDEVVLVELQGALNVETTYEGEHDGKFVGTLTVDDALKLPKLRIGNHLLEGKVVNLPKPLAVIHKNKTRREQEHDGYDFEFDTRSTETSWDAVAIVKRKILFSKRPIPIVGKSTK